MRFDGYDFLIVGAILGVGGGLLFAKGYLMPSFLTETAQTYFNSNPFLLRNSIVTKHEAVAGAVWMVASLAAFLIGTVRTVRAGQSGYLISSVFDIVVLLAAALVLWRLTVAATDWTSRREYLPKIIAMSRDAYARDIFVIFHSGQYREEMTTNVKPSEEAVKRRWAAAETFDRLGKLLDDSRREGEDYQAYALRLARCFPGIGKD